MKKELIYGISIALLLLVAIGFTYAYFTGGVTGEGTDQVVTTGTLSLVYKDGQEITLDSAYPGDSVEKVFTVTNTGTLDTEYSINFTNLINTIINEELVVSYTCTSYIDYVDQDNKGEISGTCEGITNQVIEETEESISSTITNNISIASGITHEYTLTITFIETGEAQDYNQGKTFGATINVNDLKTKTVSFNVNGGSSSHNPITVAYDGTYGTLPTPTRDYYDFLGWYTQAEGGTKIESTTKVKSVSDQTLYAQWQSNCTFENSFIEGTLKYKMVDNTCVNADNVSSLYVTSSTGINFGAVSSDTNGKGLYRSTDLTKTEDTNGDGIGEEVLYFRGAVENNYVVFADFCWRIVRTNEDGSIKLRYGGEATASGDTYTCPQTGKAIAIGNNIYYVFNTTSNAPKYVGYMYDTNTSSDAKTTIDAWYQTNIANKGTSVTNLIVDTPYCNDTTTYTPSDPISGFTYYGAHGRLGTNKTPQYKCPQASDAYTVNSANGNGKLTYPIALLTADEVAYAGGLGGSNSTYYLYMRLGYYTMSPSVFNPSLSGAALFHVSHTGSLYNDGGVSINHGLLPAISLSAEAEVTQGTGLYNDPYRIG